MPLGPDDRVRVSDQVVFRSIGGEAVLLHLDRGVYFGLDPIGSRVWDALVEHGCARPVLAAVVEEYEVTEEALVGDVTRLLDELADNGLIERHP
jgi:hypothetical protein